MDNNVLVQYMADSLKMFARNDSKKYKLNGKKVISHANLRVYNYAVDAETA